MPSMKIQDKSGIRDLTREDSKNRAPYACRQDAVLPMGVTIAGIDGGGVSPEMGMSFEGLTVWAGLASRSLRPLGFAPAFGRAVAASRRRLDAGLEAPLYLRSKDNFKSRFAVVRRVTGMASRFGIFSSKCSRGGLASRSLRPLGFAPAFGRAGAASRRRLDAGLEKPRFTSEASATDAQGFGLPRSKCGVPFRRAMFLGGR